MKDNTRAVQRIDEIEKMREVMGTKPRVPENMVPTTKFIRGGEQISVRMISPTYPLPNVYAGMFAMAVSTWGGAWDSSVDKWNNAPVKARRDVVLAVLQRKALPLALEHPTFLFEIMGCSRSAFDQIARARIGTTFASMGVRDNAHPDLDVVVPPKVYDDLESLTTFIKGVLATKRAYVNLLKQGQRSWQDARAVLPMGSVHRFMMNVNYAALSGFMAKRLMFEEQYDTVAVAWKMRQELGRHYALLAEPLRPACDLAKRCVYHTTHSLSEAFGCLFRGCGRWGEEEYEYAEFNEASADEADIELWLGEKIPKPLDEPNWDKAFEKDRRFFEETL